MSDDASTPAEYSRWDRLDRDRDHVVRTVVGTLALALYVSWMTADLVPRWLAVLTTAVLAGPILYRATDHREQWTSVGYTLALLVLLTPLFVVLPDALAAGTYGVGALELTLVVGKLVLVVPFVTLALVVGYATYRYAGGRGVRARLADARS